MSPDGLTARVAKLEAHREDTMSDIGEIKKDVKELLAAQNRFRGAVKVALVLSALVFGAAGAVIGYFVPKG